MELRQPLPESGGMDTETHKKVVIEFIDRLSEAGVETFRFIAKFVRAHYRRLHRLASPGIQALDGP